MADRGHSLLDIHFSRFLAERSSFTGSDKDKFAQLVRTLTCSLEAGHSCLPVTAAESFFLERCTLVSHGEQTPLILHRNKLYLQRYFNYEALLARNIRALSGISFQNEDRKTQLECFFADEKGDEGLQRKAAQLTTTNALTIICGGPGTGKTTTVVKILAMLLEVTDQSLAIALVAPTGKAAMRLSESISNGIARIGLDEKIQEGIPRETKTIHRLLGFKQHSPSFRHTKDNPLGFDVVVVDEASMVDLALMSKLVDALKPGSRLILLGDKDQLASVESGSVLGDLIKSLPSNTVELKKTYRFDSTIKRLAEAINAGKSDSAWKLFLDTSSHNISMLQSEYIDHIVDRYANYMAVVYQQRETDIREIFAKLNIFQVLCAVHYGARGVDGINTRVESSLARLGYPCRPGGWYPGRPVLVTRNDYGLDLYNGDIGICLMDRDDGLMKVWFEKPGGELRSYSPYRLPKCETVYAMTIHKSQGSEFDEVVVVLPETDNKILSRELIYTAVTRARKTITLVADNFVFSQALSRNIERHSGLTELLEEE